MGTPQQDISIKAKLVNLIGAVRTLMRGACFPLVFATKLTIFIPHAVPLIFVNIGVIIYEIVLGG